MLITVYIYICVCVYIYIYSMVHRPRLYTKTSFMFHYVFSYFPTCQVRVVRFYHSCSPPPPRLAIHLCLHFHVHCCLANSSPSSLPTSELSGHRWTSTWDLPSSVGTAGPQPGTFPAQWAPLDLNLGPAQLSVHRWTSTWDLPSSVYTAQPGTCPA